MIYPHGNIWPKIHELAFIAPSADIIGNVEMGSESSAWFQTVIRGDLEPIRIGCRTNIQDQVTIHTTRRYSKVTIGDDVSVGHRALLHGCVIGNRVLIGMGAIIMDNVTIGDDCIVGAGALLTKGMNVPAGSMVLGSPAKVVRGLKPEEVSYLLKSAENYVADIKSYSHVPTGKRFNLED